VRLKVEITRNAAELAELAGLAELSAGGATD